MNEESQKTASIKAPLKEGVTLRFSWLFVSVVLAIIIIVMTIIWKPWQDTASSTRKISVTGEATIKAEPDEYVLSPYFEFTNVDRSKASAELNAQSTTINAKLKELGVKDEQIKSNTNGYDKYGYYGSPTDMNTLTLSYTITLNDKDIAQKAQDYLLTLKPKGQLSPLAHFSETKSKELQLKAREKAIDDAKHNAEITAKQFNAKVGKIVTVSDTGLAGGPVTYSTQGMTATDAKLESSSISSLPIQVGQDEYKYSISVEYELK